jgi:hypothetical protein
MFLAVEKKALSMRQFLVLSFFIILSNFQAFLPIVGNGFVVVIQKLALFPFSDHFTADIERHSSYVCGCDHNSADTVYS